MERVRVPIAPAAEQRRIVARIDELFAEIAEGETALRRARQGLDTWRRALLKAAVTGELTRDWREANRPTETGLVARIRAEREASNGRPLRGHRANATEPLDTAALPKLPEGWVWATHRKFRGAIQCEPDSSREFAAPYPAGLGNPGPGRSSA